MLSKCSFFCRRSQTCLHSDVCRMLMLSRTQSHVESNWCHGFIISSTLIVIDVMDTFWCYVECHLRHGHTISVMQLVSRFHVDCHWCLQRPFNIISLVSRTHYSLVTFVSRTLCQTSHSI